MYHTKSTPLVSKLPHVGTTIFTTMSQLAHQHKAINLAQGFPDFGTSEKLIELVHHYMKQGHNQYAPMAGALPLRERIAEIVYKQYNYRPEVTDEITVTCGATEACFTAIASVVKPGDEVILFEPAFDAYAAAVELCGAKPVYVHLHYPYYSIDWMEVRAKLSHKTSMLILNSPHNPTGSVITPHDIQELHSILEGTNLILLSDEVYEHIIFDKRMHESILKYEELRKRSFVVASLGKTLHCTGWRVGYCIAPSKLTNEFRKVHQYNTFSAHTASQYAMADYLADDTHYTSLGGFFQNKRDFFINKMKKSRFEIFPAAGSYFQLASYKEISDEPDTDFSERLVKQYGVAVIPLSPFYHQRVDEKIIRFCFAKKEETLEQAAEILCKI